MNVTITSGNTVQDTIEQKKLYWWMQNEAGNAVLSSVAGSGKTSSIMEGLNYLDEADDPELGKVLIVSFTRVIADELHKRIKDAGHTNVVSATLNSVGNTLLKKQFPNATLDAFKTDNILVHDIYGGRRDEQAKREIAFLKWPLKKMIGLLKAYVVAPGPEVFCRWKELFDYQSLEWPETSDENFKAVMIAKFPDVLMDVYARSLEIIEGFYDYDDQKFGPVRSDSTLQSQPSPYSWIIVDEAQDLNLCDIELINKLRGPQTRLLFVGDPKQAIYGFRGALSDSMEQIEKRFMCEKLTLSVCWRCPDSIIEHAQQWCPQITAPVPNPRGEGEIETKQTAEFVKEVRAGDFVICRTTAPLIKRCLQQLTLGKRAMVKGKEIGATLTSLLEALINKFRVTELGDFLYHLGEYRRIEVMKYTAMGREEKAEEIEDRCNALEAFAETSSSIMEMRRKIDALFSDDLPVGASDVILFLTGHKCKGLQTKRVWWLRPDLCPSKRAKKTHQIEQEHNIQLIITTRAEESLFFVQKERDEK